MKKKFNFWAYVSRQAARGESYHSVQQRCSKKGGAASATSRVKRVQQQERFTTMMHQQKLESPFTETDVANIKASATRRAE